MGFATIENLMYIFGADNLGSAWQTAGLRAVTAVPAHATFAAVMGYFVGLAKFNHKNERSLMFRGFLLATILHGFYDFFLFQNYTPGLYIGAIVSLIIGIRFSVRSIKLHKSHPDAKQKELKVIPVDNNPNEGFDAPTKPQ